MNKKKNLGQVFTPKNIVHEILEFVDYKNNFLKKHIIDNSAGDGAFITKIIDIYCNKFLNINNNKKLLKKHLEKYIHALEIDEVNFKNLVINADKTAGKYGIYKIKWDFAQSDTIFVKHYNNKMDYVVGNPPYVRVHNLKQLIREEISKFEFCNSSTTDLYLVFFEIGIKMLNSRGKLGYITPSSYFYSLSGQKLRKFLVNSKWISLIKDYEHKKIFKDITTYSAITIINKKKKNDFFVFINSDNVKINKKLNKSFLNFENKKITSNLIAVKNGLATLNDNVFLINRKNNNLHLLKDKNVLECVKISSNKLIKIIFPYDKNGNLEEWENFSDEMKNYLLSKKKILHRESKNKWYEYGRTQGINDIPKKKIAISNLISENKKCYLTKISANVAVISGFYIITSEKIIDKFQLKILNNEFFKYVKNLKKYKNGNYYTYNSKDVKRYIIEKCL